MSTTKLNTTAYHPQCDGLVERFNAFISQTLTMYVSANQRNWDEFLPSTLFAYRTSPSASTGDSTFYLLYGREPRFPVDIKLLPPNVDKLATSIATHRERIVTQLEEAQRLAKLNIERTQQTMKAHYDQQAKPTKYKVGQKVWIYTPKTKKGLSKKLLYKWHGPFRIVKQLSPVNFQLRTQANRLLSAPVHVNRMKLYFDPDGRPTHSPDVDIEHDDLMLDESELPEDSFASETTMVNPARTSRF